MSVAMFLTDEDYVEQAKLLGWMNPPRVVIDNDASDDATIIRMDGASVKSHKTLSAVLSHCNLLIRKADLSGFMDVSLSVTDHEGNKVLDESTLSYIHKMLDAEEVEGPIPPLIYYYPLKNPEIIKGYFPWCEKYPSFESVPRVIKGMPLNFCSYGEEQHGPKMFVDFVLMAPESMALGDGDSSSIGALAPVMVFWLDSGAFHHVTGDEGILSNIRAMPSWKTVTVADGSRLLVTKVGDIQTPDIQIKDVYYVPRLKMNLISVRALAKRKIVTTFYEHHAELSLAGVQIGGAIVDEAVSLYRLSYLQAA